jgi:hypothetical protein
LQQRKIAADIIVSRQGIIVKEAGGIVAAAGKASSLRKLLEASLQLQTRHRYSLGIIVIATA